PDPGGVGPAPPGRAWAPFNRCSLRGLGAQPGGDRWPLEAGGGERRRRAR
ncbi:unnamed protein product, partial [Durusdinium trenchii]